MKRSFAWFLIFCFFLSAAVQSFATEPGRPAPFFAVYDGNDARCDLETLKGKVVAGFYESRDSSEKNNELKEMLNSFYDANKKHTEGAVTKFAVVDGTPANFASRWIWKKVLRKNSAAKCITIYCDWDGSMKNAFGFAENDSNFFIIDKSGTIRYFTQGKVPASEFEKIRSILVRLTSNI